MLELTSLNSDHYMYLTDIMETIILYERKNGIDHPGRSHPRGGGTLIFSYIRRLGPFFGFKILNFNIFLGFQKNKYFLGF